MEFNYNQVFNQDVAKWKEFDKFLSELSEIYPEEFSKEIYISKRFIALRYQSTPPDITYVFNDKVPKEIQDHIIKKLKDIFPKQL